MLRKNHAQHTPSNIVNKRIYKFIFAVSLCQMAHASETATSEIQSAHAVYPGHFTRPPSLGDKYNTWEGAKGADVGSKKLDLSRLPSRIDNSERPEFPPVYKQIWGACGQFAAVASMFTYEMNVLTGNTADSLKHSYPAHFSWNMVNSAKNQGSEAYHGWEVAKRIGIPDAETYGGVRLNEIGLWPNDYNIWRNAMNNRVTGYRYTPAVTIEQLHEVRGWLYDRNNPNSEKPSKGGLLALDGRMGELKKVTVEIPKGSHEEGKKVWKKWGPSGYGHGIACVGYDDDVAVDLNDDGKITNNIDINGDGKVTLADWEKGAYIVVNSWGEEFANNGKIYLLYSAMTDSTWLRGNFFGRIEVAQYTPRKTLKLKLSHSDRSDLRMTVGISSNENAVEAEFNYNPEHLNGWEILGENKPGNTPMAGVDNDTPLEVGVDITHLYEKLANDNDGKARLFIKFHTVTGSKASGELHSCSIRSYSEVGKFIDESTIEVENGNFGDAKNPSISLQSTINVE
ncbi:MAG: hypothetical protein ACSHX6_02405 [Akkermansiaceae bacterium]